MTLDFALNKFILTEIITETMRVIFKENKIINWVWGNDFNISKIIRVNIPFLPNFEAKKLESFLNTFELKLSNPHDVRFYLWWGWYKFIRANFILSKDLYKIIHWTNFIERISISIVVFLILMKFWRKYFNFK